MTPWAAKEELKSERAWAPTLAADFSRRISESGALTGIGNVASAERQAPLDPRLILRSPHHTTRFVSCDAMRGAHRRCCRAAAHCSAQCSVCSVLHASDRIFKRARGAPTSRQLPIQLEAWNYMPGDMLPRVTFLSGPTSPEDPHLIHQAINTRTIIAHRQIKTPHSFKFKILKSRLL